jgi:hypothetical protein
MRGALSKIRRKRGSNPARAAAVRKMRPKPRRDFRPNDQGRANNLAVVVRDYRREPPT